MFGFDDQVPQKQLQREKAKARDLRKTQWWQNKVAAKVCYYCGQQTEAKKITMDHIVPLARGGRSTKGNIVACCKECNTKKRTLLPLEWEEYMNRLGDG